MQFLRRWKIIARRLARQYSWADLRWSHITILCLIVAGALINLALPNGWTVWPFVAVFSMLTWLNEAAERNGQGIPPIQVYALVVMVLGFWFIGVFIMTRVNVFIQLLGIFGIACYTYHGYMKYKAHLQLIADRRHQGLCVHCGFPNDGSFTYCVNCGHEPDPELASQQRMTAIAQYGKTSDRARQVLTTESYANNASRKEKALLANSPRRRGRAGKR